MLSNGGGLKNFEGLTPARLMTSTGITVSISSAPLARMTRALFEAIFTLYLLKTQLKQDFQELSHESPTKPRPEPQTLSPSKGTEDGSGGEVEEY